MRRLSVILAALLFAACAKENTTVAEQDEDKPGLQVSKEQPGLNAPGKGARVEIPTSVGTGSGYLSLPKGGGKHPAIIVIQEWWGVDDWIKEQTDRMSGEGYVAFAADLYRGHVTSDPKEAHELMRGLPEDRAMTDLEGAFNYLASHPNVDPTRIAVIGWCMGGGYALALATEEPRLKAAIINYGRLVTDPAAIRKIEAAVLGNFAGQDRGIPAKDVEQFSKALRSAGKDVDIKVYPQQQHAFMNPNNKEGYDAAAAQDAWQRIYAFLNAKLGAAPPA